MQHNAHPRRSVHAPWRPNAPQNRQGSRGHPEFSKTKPVTRPETPKRPQSCPPCNTIRTRVARSTPHGVRTRPKTVRVPGHTPKRPETPQNAPKPKLAARDCLVVVCALVSFCSTVHGTTKISAGGGGAPPRQESRPTSARFIRPNCHYRDGPILITRCAQERPKSTKTLPPKRSIVAEIAPISTSRRC